LTGWYCSLILPQAARGGEARFHEIRKALPAAQGLGRGPEAGRWLAGLERVETWFEATNCRIPAGFRESVTAVAEAFTHPGPFLCFSHGDPAPTNNHLACRSLRLLDFEYGAFRHALYDLTAWNVLCPLPLPWVAILKRGFREAFVPGFSLVGDELDFDQAWAAMTVYRALAILSWLGPEILDQDRPWAEMWSARQAVLSALIRPGRAAAGFGDLAPLAQAAGRLERSLRRRWPELAGKDDLPVPWPAAGGKKHPG